MNTIEHSVRRLRELQQEAKAIRLQIQTGPGQNDESPMFSREIDEVCSEVSEKLESPDPWVPSGIPKYDDLLDGGLRCGEVEILGARPRMGKSALALQRIMFAAEKGIRTSLWSFEMSPPQWVRRAACSMTGVSMKRVRRGEMSQMEGSLYRESLSYIGRLPIEFATLEGARLEEPGDRLSPFEANVQLAKYAGTGLIVLDYVQLMDPPQANTREQEVSKLSRVLKRTALDCYMPILALAQLGRQADGRVPVLSDLRESGALEQDADIVTFLHRPYLDDGVRLDDDGVLVVAKNRDGEAGTCPISYMSREFRFEQINPGGH